MTGTSIPGRWMLEDISSMNSFHVKYLGRDLTVFVAGLIVGAALIIGWSWP